MTLEHLNLILETAAAAGEGATRLAVWYLAIEVLRAAMLWAFGMFLIASVCRLIGRHETAHMFATDVGRVLSGREHFDPMKYRDRQEAVSGLIVLQGGSNDSPTP